MNRELYSPSRAARFYVPLLLQAFSQSLTYPLVGSIVSHGPDGVDGLTAFTLGQVILFMIGALSGGLLMTGMVFARTREGLASFRRLNYAMMGTLLLVQVLACVPPLDGLCFSHFLNLPPHLAEIARRTTLFGIVMQAGFFMRNVPLVVLFNAYASGEANAATIVRIAITLSFALAFPLLGWTGADWGLFALTAPVLVEWILSEKFAAKYRRRLEAGDAAPARTQFRFAMPLGIGAALLAVSPFVTAAFVGRAANATDMLAVHYVTLGIANPVLYAALRMQAVAIQFPPEWKGDRRLLKFAIVSGLVLGAIPLALSVSAIGDWYYGTCQNVPPRMLSAAKTASAFYLFVCVIQALRGRIEGLAALERKPQAVLAGQFSYFAVLACALAVMLPAGVAGWVMGVVSICLASASSAFTTGAWLAVSRKRSGGASGSEAEGVGNCDKGKLETVEIAGVKARVARSLWDRMRGLIGAPKPPAGEGLLILRCNSIHTFFMSYPIDATFLDRSGRPVKTVRNIPPWRPFVWGGFRAVQVLETAAKG